MLQVHVKHTDGTYETTPYFCLPANDLTDVIAPSCMSCFDYTNGLADLVVSYMGVPYRDKPMAVHEQHVVVRNGRGQAMLDAVKEHIRVRTAEACACEPASGVGRGMARHVVLV